eukprot:sb/3465603/
MVPTEDHDDNVYKEGARYERSPSILESMTSNLSLRIRTEGMIRPLRQISEDSDTSSIGAPSPILSEDGVLERRTGIDLGHLMVDEEIQTAPGQNLVVLAVPDGNHGNHDGNQDSNHGNQGCERRRKSILPEWKLVSEGSYERIRNAQVRWLKRNGKEHKEEYDDGVSADLVDTVFLDEQEGRYERSPSILESMTSNLSLRIRTEGMIRPLRQISEDSDTSSIGAPSPISEDGVLERRTGIDLGHLIVDMGDEEILTAPSQNLAVLAVPDGNHGNNDGNQDSNHGNQDSNHGNQGCERRQRRKSILPEWKLVSEGASLRLSFLNLLNLDSSFTSSCIYFTDLFCSIFSVLQMKICTPRRSSYERIRNAQVKKGTERNTRKSMMMG